MDFNFAEEAAVALDQFFLYTMAFMTNARRNAVITSKTECCFKNIVARMMLKASTKETRFASLWFLMHLLFTTAR